MFHYFEIDLSEVNTTNTEVQFHRDEQGNPYMILAMYEGETHGTKYFIAACEMPKGLSVKRKEAEDMLSQITGVLSSLSSNIHLNFAGEESKSAILAIYCTYPYIPFLGGLQKVGRTMDSYGTLECMKRLCHDYVVQKLNS